MKVTTSLMMAAMLVGNALPAFADGTTPSPTPLGDTISLEISPEWSAASPNAYKDSYAKIGFSHSLGNGFSLGASLQDTVPTAGKASSFQPETTLGYKWKANALTFGVSAGLGYNSGTVGGTSSTKNDIVGAYYVASATLDWKLNSKWTWNVVNARYRNAFDNTWITPKVATGLTYQIDPRQATYVAVGYAWKDTDDGDGLLGDKINLALGYKLGF